ncbi:helix-turn-helix domain-containing protein [Streptomyces sp. NPDC060031]|uniref:helix-turn-helix domain-containing protein n=1 Tax=Streptomyces sp. NPDC060031 TaxID=3347043 RepID=UPI003696B972
MGEAERSAETQMFARLMRELKERAGLSYGTLARRLHTSTSTLHRYCNGEAVPTEFAAVDRFARACGASPGEAVALHRAWLLADARRRALARVQPAQARAEPAAAVAVVPAAAPTRPADPAPWYRRRRATALAAAGVTAVAVGVAALALALAAADPGGRTPTAGPGAGRTAPTGASAPASAAPLRAVVRTHVWAAGCDHAYLSAQGPGAVPAPPVEADAPGWAAGRAAVHAGTQIVEVTLHGTGAGSVVLQDLEVRVGARRTPLPWNVYQMSQGCGGALTPAVLAVDLDAPRPLARPVAGNDAGDPIPAPAFPLRVSAAEPVVLRVEAATTGCDCDWSLDLRWSGPSGSGTLRIDDGGHPLRTSAAVNRPVYGYAAEQGRWGR